MEAYLLRVARFPDGSLIDPDGPVAHGLDGSSDVGCKYYGLAGLLEPLEEGGTLLLESDVPHGEDLVHDHDVASDIDEDGERQPPDHSGGIGTERIVYLLSEFGELDDAVDHRVRLLLGESEHGALDVDVLAAAEILMEPHAELQDAGHVPLDVDRSRIRIDDAADQLEQRALPGAVAADHTQALALPDVQVQRSDDLPADVLPVTVHGALNVEGLADAADLDAVARVHRNLSANPFSSLLNT